MPTEAINAHFQLVLPRKWHSHKIKPICLHHAGTGDHVSQFNFDSKVNLHGPTSYNSYY